MSNLMDWFYGQLVGFLGNFFAIMGMMGAELFELTWVQSVVTLFSQLGWALFGVSVVVCCFEFGGLLHRAGEYPADGAEHREGLPGGEPVLHRSGTAL